jgi:ribosome-binding protein aMBF1 (putative translation factor)
MNFGTERNQEAWERMTPEQRAAVEKIREKHRTPEYRREEAVVRELVRQDVPPLDADADLMATLAALRDERERQGLSLTDMMEKTKIDRSTISKLENGKIPNPTYQTMRIYAAALGKRLTWKLDG